MIIGGRTMSEPTKGTNVYSIWHDILTDKYVEYSQIKFLLMQSFPNIPVSSLATQLHDLKERGLIQREKSRNGQWMYKKINSSINTYKPTKKKKSVPKSIFDFLKNNVGKTFTAIEIRNKFSPYDVRAWDILNSFSKQKIIKKCFNDGLLAYEVLPIIKTMDKHPITKYRPRDKKLTKNKELKKVKELNIVKELKTIDDSNIASIPENIIIDYKIKNSLINMSFNELIDNMLALRDENLKLKHTLDSIGHLLLQANIVEK